MAAKYRVRRCRDRKFYVQEKRAPGLAGGIWRRVSEPCDSWGDAVVEKVKLVQAV